LKLFPVYDKHNQFCLVDGMGEVRTYLPIRRLSNALVLMNIDKPTDAYTAQLELEDDAL
jgi:hypothetical protein